MAYPDPYQAYAEGSILNATPAALIVVLYETAIAAIGRGEECLEKGDIRGRGKAITNAMSAITELLVSLNHEKGGTLSKNLQQMYVYMHKRLLEAHARESREPMEEVKGLLVKLLQAWRKVAEEPVKAENAAAEAPVVASERAAGYWDEAAERVSSFSAEF
ncbi:MAG: flagellar export chaperone FliS [Acidobacteriaceae bacterium]|nr:flagellar export chaperone FliS [Acidobacteriaceae bacterium]